MKEVLIYYTNPAEEPSVSAEEILKQAEFVAKGLTNLGYDVKKLPFRLNPRYIKEEASSYLIFNLIEAIGGTDKWACLAPEIFEMFGFLYTGCPSKTFKKSETKIVAKELMRREGIPTPDYETRKTLKEEKTLKKKFVIKSNTDNASKGLELKIYDNLEEIKRVLESKYDFFAEEYIEGREFNASCIGPVGNCEILPIPEMKFINWPEHLPKLVSEAAKFDANSWESRQTVRTFNPLDSDKSLLMKLEEISKQCWRIFEARSYMRVDFRVDEKGNPYVLEVNPNPGIGEDSGFIAAAKESGMSLEETLEKIIRYSEITSY
ncbi:ATP-grasp domain-containing protein [Candidatus Pacearchaeota archaeon]|nr:ATP-grasp domain-containing protein [Candidatus Pacearchaeota archaeon]